VFFLESCEILGYFCCESCKILGCFFSVFYCQSCKILGCFFLESGIVVGVKKLESCWGEKVGKWYSCWGEKVGKLLGEKVSVKKLESCWGEKLGVKKLEWKKLENISLFFWGEKVGVKKLGWKSSLSEKVEKGWLTEKSWKVLGEKVRWVKKLESIECKSWNGNKFFSFMFEYFQTQ